MPLASIFEEAASNTLPNGDELVAAGAPHEEGMPCHAPHDGVVAADENVAVVKQKEVGQVAQALVGFVVVETRGSPLGFALVMMRSVSEASLHQAVPSGSPAKV